MIPYLDRKTGKKCVEHVYGGSILKFLYTCPLAYPLKSLIVQYPWVSSLVGWWKRQPWTRKKIAPFVKTYHIDADEFEKKIGEFISFDDFFTRKLKKGCRPLSKRKQGAIFPADGRYLFHQKISQSDNFTVKGGTFSLSELLHDGTLAKKYTEGAMAIARLCPTDYHRFHFPLTTIPRKPRPIEGFLYSVNPIATRKKASLLAENKRVVTHLICGTKEILMVEVGATCVGTIHQTYTPFQVAQKGDEKGYFSFGGSCILLLFPPETILFDSDLIAATQEGLEMRCLMGDSFGTVSL